MGIHPTSLRRALLACALATATPGLAPAAAAQNLTPVVGDPIAYRVSLPAGARVMSDRQNLHGVTRDAIVFVGAVDLMDAQEREPKVSESEARRIMTSLFMQSDTLLLALLHHGIRQRDVKLHDVVTEMRTLGGQRAAYLGGVPNDGAHARLDAHMTVKDGILYLLIVHSNRRRGERSGMLAESIHQSFVLADAPPAGQRTSP